MPIAYDTGFGTDSYVFCYNMPIQGLRGQTNALFDSPVLLSNMNLVPESFLFVLFFNIIHAGLFVYFIEQTTTLSTLKCWKDMVHQSFVFCSAYNKQ